jgi:inner membrane protein
MASLGHVAIGIAAARMSRPQQLPRWRAVVLWSALSLLPDADVVGFSLGVEYGDPWGHRGATHSLAFSIVVGALLGAAASLVGRPAWRVGALATGVLVSHALLDTLTDGGLGCALLWPFDLTRYFAPWNPIPVAPIGLSFVSMNGLTIALTEAILFFPILMVALWPPNPLAR